MLFRSHVVTAPSLRLDLEQDRHALEQTLQDIQPRLLLLDPLVRLHRLDENSAADISGLLGFLRHLNRQHDLAVILVHHMAKRARQDPGLALRGSSDLFAWIDSACYLARRGQQLRLSVQHRAAPAPEPMLLTLAGGHSQPCRLLIHGNDTQPPPLAEAVRHQLRQAQHPCSRAALRQILRVNNARLGQALSTLEERGLAIRAATGWTLPDTPHDPQLSLTD